MVRKSQRLQIKHLVAIAASLALAGGATLTATVAPASAAQAHAATVTHHATKSTHHVASKHKTTSTHKSAAHKATPSRTRSAKVTHKKAPSHVKHTVAAATSAPTPAPAAVTAPANCANGDLVPTSANLDLVRAATVCLVNQQRASAGLPGLRENGALDAAAQAHSYDMVAGDYFDHVAPSGTDMLSRIVAAGFATLANVMDAGENIAAASGALATPAATVASWMASPPHRANILDPTFQQTGLGVTPAVPAMLGIGGSGATYTQTFGTAS
jgi:uncharacterized protein YkwD